MRVSDADRNRTLDELARHCRDGRIDVDEYGDRVERALLATDLTELDAVLADLPMMRIADPRSSTGSRFGHLWRARLVIVLAFVLLAAAVALAVAAQWVLTAVLVVGWLLGVLQGRVAGRR
jgi:hypothetical protein